MVECAFPSLKGLQIVVNGAETAAPGVAVGVTVVASSVTVTVASGSGQQFTEREFTGGGLTGFDASEGVQINATSLSETTSPSGKRGTLGGVTSITGSVDCGNQNPGSSTIMLSGSVSQGPVSGSLAHVFVICEPTGVLTLAITSGSPQLFLDFFANGQDSSLHVYVVSAGSSTTVTYFDKGPGVASVTSTGAHINAAALQLGIPTAQAHTLHMTGDVTCST